MFPCRKRYKEAKQLVADGAEVYFPLCFMKHNVSLTVPCLISLTGGTSPSAHIGTINTEKKITLE